MQKQKRTSLKEKENNLRYRSMCVLPSYGQLLNPIQGGLLPSTLYYSSHIDFLSVFSNRSTFFPSQGLCICCSFLLERSFPQLLAELSLSFSPSFSRTISPPPQRASSIDSYYFLPQDQVDFSPGIYHKCLPLCSLLSLLSLPENESSMRVEHCSLSWASQPLVQHLVSTRPLIYIPVDYYMNVMPLDFGGLQWGGKKP